MLVHGKNTVVTVNAVDLSEFANTTVLPREADTHDVTTYGNNAHRYHGGLLDGKVTIGGIYDSDAAGPAATLEPLLGTTVPVVIQMDGAGTGKAQRAFDGVLSSYEESSPVADMVTWKCEFQIDGDVDVTPQV